MAEKDTEIPGSRDFPSTVWSRLVHGAPPREAAEYLATRYWKPAYLYIRRRWKRSNEDAKDLTQQFFAEAFEKKLLSKAEPSRGSFRRFLRASLENFLRNSLRDSKTLKRGGGVRIVALDGVTEADAAASREGNPEELFDREWLEAVFERCKPKMKELYAGEGRVHYYEIFRRYDIEGSSNSRPTYDSLAAEFKVAITDIRNWLAHARGRWQKLIREELLETTSSAADLEQEVKELFGR